MTTSVTGSEGRPGDVGQCAFTLIELSVVVFIMAMLMAVAIPSFVRSYNASQLQAAARAIVTTCQLARFQAVLHQRAMTLSLDSDRKTLTVDASPAANAAGEVVPAAKVIELPRQVTVAALEIAEESSRHGGQVAVQFYPNGTADSLSVTLRGSEKNDLLVVTVDPVTARATASAVKS